MYKQIEVMKFSKLFFQQYLATVKKYIYILRNFKITRYLYILFSLFYFFIPTLQHFISIHHYPNIYIQKLPVPKRHYKIENEDRV